MQKFDEKDLHYFFHKTEIDYDTMLDLNLLFHTSSYRDGSKEAQYKEVMGCLQTDDKVLARKKAFIKSCNKYVAALSKLSLRHLSDYFAQIENHYTHNNDGHKADGRIFLDIPVYGFKDVVLIIPWDKTRHCYISDRATDVHTVYALSPEFSEKLINAVGDRDKMYIPEGFEEEADKDMDFEKGDDSDGERE